MTGYLDGEFSKRKLSRLNEHLETRFGLRIDTRSVDHLREVHDHYRSKREYLLQRYGYADALDREDYAKAVMISEAVALMLREIAPSRLKPRTRRKGQK